MTTIIKKIDDNKLCLEINNIIYSKEALIASAYNFSDKAYIYLNEISDDKTAVYFIAKDNNYENLEKCALQLCNDLVDQQLRIDLEEKFGNLRDIIIKQAFSPIK